MDEDTPLAEADARSLRFLKGLVTVLTVTMIAGVLTIVALLVIRLNAPSPVGPALPERIALPAGSTPLAITQGPGWIAVVTTDSRILIFDAAGTEMVQEVTVALPGE